jgi:hypothetical protein
VRGQVSGGRLTRHQESAMHLMIREVRELYKHHGLHAEVILWGRPSLTVMGVLSPMFPQFSSDISFFKCPLVIK